MVVTYYIKSCAGAERHKGICISLLLLVAEENTTIEFGKPGIKKVHHIFAKHVTLCFGKTWSFMEGTEAIKTTFQPRRIHRIKFQFKWMTSHKTTTTIEVRELKKRKIHFTFHLGNCTKAIKILFQSKCTPSQYFHCH